MRAKRSKTGGLRSLFVPAAVVSVLSAPAYSFDFTVGEDVKGSLINLFTGGFSQRLRDQNDQLIAAPGTTGFLTGFQDAHTGDLNYNKGDLFALYVKGSNELLLTFPDKWKFFVRDAWLFDAKAGDTEFVPLSNPAYTQAAHDLRLYDLWASKDFEMFGRSSRVRVGRQVINWGESLFIAGGVNATAAIDQYRLTYPGIPLKEVVLPAEMVSWAVSPYKGVNIESYYQFRWNQNRLVPVGTFFSTSDYIGEGKGPNWFFLYNPRYAAIHGGVYAPQTPAPTAYTTGKVTNQAQALALAIANNYSFCSAVNVVTDISGNRTCSLDLGAPYLTGDQTPPVGKQFGISTHYKPEGTAIDVGLYYEHFHEKQPYVKYLPASVPLGVGQQLVYPANHNLYGASLNLLAGQWAIGSELSYRPKDPILVDPFSCSDLGGGGANCNGNWATYRDAHKWQWNTTWWRAVNPSDTDWYAAGVRALGAQQSNIQGEFALIHYPGVSNHQYQGLGLLSDLSFDVNSKTGTGPDRTGRHFGTADSFGIVQYFDLTFDSTIIPGWQVIPNVTFSLGIAGDTPNENYTWFQGFFATTYAVTFTQNLQHWSGSLLYVTYRGGDPSILRNFYADRDWWGASVTYTF
jgi:Protein of unknown function (DUF1302)